MYRNALHHKDKELLRAPVLLDYADMHMHTHTHTHTRQVYKEILRAPVLLDYADMHMHTHAHKYTHILGRCTKKY